MITDVEKKGTKYNLSALNVDIEDTSYRSDNYFVVSDLDSTFTAGKNFFTINGSPNLSPNSKILLEILDSAGNPLYYEIVIFLPQNISNRPGAANLFSPSDLHYP